MTSVTCSNGALTFKFKECERILTSKIYAPFRLYPTDEGGYFLNGQDDKVAYLSNTAYDVEGVGEQTLAELVQLIEDGTICGLTNVDNSSLASFEVTGDGNGDGVILTLTQDRADAGLDMSANEVKNNIGGDHVVVIAQEHFTAAQDPSISRIAPVMELLKNDVVVCTAATGYQRHTEQHTSSSNSLVYTDPNPSVGDKYSLRAQRGSNEVDPMPIECGYFQIKVVEKLQVVKIN